MQCWTSESLAWIWIQRVSTVDDRRNTEFQDVGASFVKDRPSEGHIRRHDVLKTSCSGPVYRRRLLGGCIEKRNGRADEHSDQAPLCAEMWDVPTEIRRSFATLTWVSARPACYFRGIPIYGNWNFRSHVLSLPRLSQLTSPFLLICHPPSVEVLLSGLASQSFQDSMWKSGSYTASSHQYYLSCYRWHALYFRTKLCPNSISSLSSWRC